VAAEQAGLDRRDAGARAPQTRSRCRVRRECRMVHALGRTAASHSWRTARPRWVLV
jgi:hypothetical protein